MKITDLLFEISNEERLRILHLLEDGPKKLSNLAKILDITTSETSRHLGRLADRGTIEKNTDGEYCLNGYGKLLIQMTSYFEFLLDKRDYIQTHDLSVIPSGFIAQLGNLKDSMIMSGVFSVMDAHLAAVLETEKRIWIMSPGKSSPTVEAVGEKIASGTDVKIILEEESLETDELASWPSKHFRTLQKVPILVGVFDDRAGVCFPDRSGNIDLSMMLVGSSEEFSNWILEIFQHYWNIAGYLVE